MCQQREGRLTGLIRLSFYVYFLQIFAQKHKHCKLTAHLLHVLMAYQLQSNPICHLKTIKWAKKHHFRTAPGQEEVFQMDSMGSRRHLEEEGWRLSLQRATASCCKCIHIKQKNCSVVILVEIYKTHTCASSINTRAVQLSSDC